MSQLKEDAVLDPQVAITLLRICGSYCRLIHLARTTPPNLVSDALSLFDDDVRQCFTRCLAVETQDVAWNQAQLSLSYGGLGLHSLSTHSCAAYIVSLCSSGLCVVDSPHLINTVAKFNSQVSTPDLVTIESLTANPVSQRDLSGKLEKSNVSFFVEGFFHC